MVNEGKIKSYHAERGFGFIDVVGNTKDLFFHSRDFPQPHIAPRIGEKLQFIIVEQQGKFKAERIVRLELGTMQPPPASASLVRPSHRLTAKPQKTVCKSKYLIVLGLLMVAGLVIFAYTKYQNSQQQKQLRTQQLIEAQRHIVEEQRRAQGDLPRRAEREHSAVGRQTAPGHSTAAHPAPAKPSVQTVSQFRCDGRTHCSQMRSYEEAVFFLNNCPGTKMDGNGDGIPCERQFGK